MDESDSLKESYKCCSPLPYTSDSYTFVEHHVW